MAVGAPLAAPRACAAGGWWPRDPAVLGVRKPCLRFGRACAKVFSLSPPRPFLSPPRPLCLPRECGGPRFNSWVPAYAGMTKKGSPPHPFLSPPRPSLSPRIFLCHPGEGRGPRIHSTTHFVSFVDSPACGGRERLNGGSYGSKSAQKIP